MDIPKSLELAANPALKDVRTRPSALANMRHQVGLLCLTPIRFILKQGRHRRRPSPQQVRGIGFAQIDACPSAAHEPVIPLPRFKAGCALFDQSLVFSTHLLRRGKAGVNLCIVESDTPRRSGTVMDAPRTNRKAIAGRRAVVRLDIQPTPRFQTNSAGFVSLGKHLFADRVGEQLKSRQCRRRVHLANPRCLSAPMRSGRLSNLMNPPASLCS